VKIVVAGGSGFLGSLLCGMYAEDGHDVRVLTRSLPPGRLEHDPGTGMPGITRVGWTSTSSDAALVTAIDGADAIVNLAGAPLPDARWTKTRKRTLRDSRVLATEALAQAIASTPQRPRVFVSASGAGYYGHRGDEPLTEAAVAGDDFLARLCVEWERAATAASADGTRVVCVRSGVVLERTGGALPKMSLPFRFFGGGHVGSGRQYVSWIHQLDWVELVRWIVQDETVRGPVNATAPHPVTNAEFSRALGRALHRPSLIPVPGFLLRAALGEMADMLLTGQRVIPARARQAGFHFRYPEIEIAFRGIFGE
jgi:uncharacterized protein (TIGR01777 family)